MNKTITYLSVFVLSLPVLAQEKIEPTQLIVDKIRPLLGQQADSIDYFTTPFSMIGIGVVTKNLEKRVFYTNTNVDYVLSGMMFDTATKQNVNANILAQLDVALPTTLTRQLTELNAVKMGTGSKNIYAFVDMNCGVCHRLHKTVEHYFSSGKFTDVTIHYIPIGILGGDSDKKAQTILGQKTNEDALALFADGMSRKPLSNHDASMQSGVQKTQENEGVFRDFSFIKGVPFVVAEIDGNWKFQNGLPSNDFFDYFTSQPQAPVGP